MVEIRVIYVNSKEEILRFNDNEAMGKFIAENADKILNIKKLDNRRKIRITTKDSKRIIRSICDDMSITEGVAYVIDLVNLEEDRIRSIDILDKREEKKDEV